MKKKPLEVARDIASDLHKAGGMSMQTMRVFAAYLNTSPSTIQQWEQGQKRPNGLALRVLALIDHKGLSIFII